jgi:hypothetical protein
VFRILYDDGLEPETVITIPEVKTFEMAYAWAKMMFPAREIKFIEAV